MKWRGLVLVLMTGHAWAQDPPDEVVADPRALRTTFGDRFAQCYESEGGSLRSEDREMLTGALGLVAARVASAEAHVDDCDADDPTAAKCVTALRGLTCGALAERLSNLTRPTTTSPPPAWAVRYAGAITTRAIACLRREPGVRISRAEERAIGGFRDQLASAFGASSRQPGCHADEVAVDACVTSIGETPCASLGPKLSEDPSAMTAPFSEACEYVIRCDAAGEE